LPSLELGPSRTGRDLLDQTNAAKLKSRDLSFEGETFSLRKWCKKMFLPQNPDSGYFTG